MSCDGVRGLLAGRSRRRRASTSECTGALPYRQPPAAGAASAAQPHFMATVTDIGARQSRADLDGAAQPHARATVTVPTPGGAARGIAPPAANADAANACQHTCAAARRALSVRRDWPASVGLMHLVFVVPVLAYRARLLHDAAHAFAGRVLLRPAVALPGLSAALTSPGRLKRARALLLTPRQNRWCGVAPEVCRVRRRAALAIAAGPLAMLLGAIAGEAALRLLRPAWLPAGTIAIVALVTCATDLLRMRAAGRASDGVAFAALLRGGAQGRRRAAGSVSWPTMRLPRTRAWRSWTVSASRRPTL